MKILMIHPHDVYSPMEPWTIRITKFADELVHKGHDVILLYFPMEQYEGAASSKAQLIPLDRQLSCRAFIRNTALLYRLARSADVVHFQKAHFYAAVPALLATVFSGKHLHYDCDDWEEKIFDVAIPKKTLTSILTGFSFHVLEHWLPFLADTVSVSSDSLKKLAINRGAIEKSLVVAPVGGDLSRFYPGRSGEAVRRKFNFQDEIVVFYHGQLHSCQYVRILLQAIKIIDQTSADTPLKFMIAGSGSDLHVLQGISKELGLCQKVIFTGFIPHVDIPDYVAAADICVAPFEDNEVTRCKSPLKIVEYMAAGKPIVASDVGEVRKMLEGVGLLTKPGSPDEMAECVLSLATQKPLRVQMSLAARQRAEERYNWRCSADNLEKAYTR